MQIQERAYLQFFYGYTEYNDEKLPFDPSLMEYFRKRLTPEILGEINEMIIQKDETVKKLYEQQKYIYDNYTHSVPDRIISINQPWLRPIVRGKAKSPVEFGTKLDISVVNGFTRLEYHSFDAYNEALKPSDMIERYNERGVIRREYWLIKFTETSKIWHIAQNAKFVFPGRHLAAPRKRRYVIKSKITLMKRNE